ncbi:hypothetical protein HUG17_1475 [Dermatophagoides farinae]|uniref:Uncharacterized protein n=1 Tax=Dermatophagoides farinae TaxID=6954 RepID=A0A9D4SL98_DERFA|nr:gem-associated protein 8-like [Dermatophagoides farinae]KAH7645937.1 hypothetical protein HUG17_1475 [Dermatophagoides farinae]
MSLSNCYSFYRQHHNHCHNWLRMNGYQGLTSIDQVFSHSNDVADSKPIDDNNHHHTTNCDEIDPEYLKTLEITHLHQQELERQRKHENSNNDWFQYVDLSQTESYSIRSKAPDNSDDDFEESTNDHYQLLMLSHIRSEGKKMHHYSRVYGDEKPLALKNLIEMENDLQYNFEKYCDRHQPPFWPILPIRIKWS